MVIVHKISSVEVSVYSYDIQFHSCMQMDYHVCVSPALSDMSDILDIISID